MKASVLLLATRYDVASYYTYQWAEHLQGDLVKQGHICLLLDCAGLYRAGSGLDEAIKCVDYVVFFGHGETGEWTALPALAGKNSTPLIDISSVSILQGRKVYASCCWSVSSLGVAYASHFGNGEYIGYNQPFNFELANEAKFRDVVNQSVMAFVKGDSASKVVDDLEKEWKNLSDDFFKGILRNCPNAAMAGFMADKNRECVQHKP